MLSDKAEEVKMMNAVRWRPHASQQKAVMILLAITVAEGAWVFWNGWQMGPSFWTYLGLVRGHSGLLPGWVIASTVVAIIISSARRFPSVRENMFSLSWMKLLSVVMALMSEAFERGFNKQVQHLQ